MTLGSEGGETKNEDGTIGKAGGQRVSSGGGRLHHSSHGMGWPTELRESC
jgi:hypothetical protein